MQTKTTKGQNADQDNKSTKRIQTQNPISYLVTLDKSYQLLRNQK